jgi:hypothetical protein
MLELCALYRLLPQHNITELCDEWVSAVVVLCAQFHYRVATDRSTAAALAVCCLCRLETNLG